MIGANITYIKRFKEIMNEQGPSRLNDFLISGVIAFFLSPMVIVMLSVVTGDWPDDYAGIGRVFLVFWLLFTIIGTIIFFIISLVVRAVQGPKNYSTTNTYNPPNYQTQYQQPLLPSTNKEDAYKSLEQLAKLKEQGIVSEEEFQDQKDRLLNS